MVRIVALDEQLKRSQEAIDRHVGKARDYGKLKNLGINLGESQVDALDRLVLRRPWHPRTEHIRRAVDLYLRAMDA